MCTCGAQLEELGVFYPNHSWSYIVDLKNQANEAELKELVAASRAAGLEPDVPTLQFALSRLPSSGMLDTAEKTSVEGDDGAGDGAEDNPTTGETAHDAITRIRGEIGKSKMEAQDLAQVIDKDGDGTVSELEFRSAS